MCRPLVFRILALCIFSVISLQRSFSQSDPFLSILKKELIREFEVLSETETPVYYMDYRISDITAFNIHAVSGSLMTSDSSRQRLGTIQVRTGSYQFDNTHDATGTTGGMYGYSPTLQLPLDNNEKAIRYFLWKYTDAAYRQASMELKSLQRIDMDTSALPDFTAHPSEKFEAPQSSDKFDVQEWEHTLASLTDIFNEEENIISGIATLETKVERKYFVNSEQSEIVENLAYAHLILSATIRSEDNTTIPLHKTYFAFHPSELPDKALLEKDIREMIGLLKELRTAPLAAPFTGPAILHPRVAAVFFHEIFGHRIEGHRLRENSDGQTFKEKLNDRILPKDFSIYSDPGLRMLGNQPLIGTYNYDDEGVHGERVEVVTNGILKQFLLSRKPLDPNARSNGHGRAQAGMSPVARQSNLIIQSESRETSESLRKKLIRECRKQGKEYGYYFVDVTGGFTQTDRYTPNAFNIMPTLVYRVYTDGRPDQLVRGVNLIGTPLAMFAEIMDSSIATDTFTGICGAESGSVPVSATAPEILVRRIETQKKPLTATAQTELLPKPMMTTEQ